MFGLNNTDQNYHKIGKRNFEKVEKSALGDYVGLLQYQFDGILRKYII